MENNIVKLYTDKEDLTGRLMCYRCRHSFPAPKVNHRGEEVECPNCKSKDRYDQHKCDPNDPFSHSLGWPYDDPTIPYDC